jgi:hypothetical protein
MLHHLTVFILPFGASIIRGNRGEHRQTAYADSPGISCVCRKCCLGRTDALGVATREEKQGDGSLAFLCYYVGTILGMHII